MNLMQGVFPMKTIDLWPNDFHLDHNRHVAQIATMLTEGATPKDIAEHLKMLKSRYHDAAQRAVFEAIQFLRNHQYRYVAITAADLQKAKEQCDLNESSTAATATDTNTSTSALSTEANLGNGKVAVQEASTASETAQL